MKLITTLLLLMLTATPAQARDALFDQGKSSWKIIIPHRAAAPETYAATELQQMLRKISGVRLPVEKSDTVPPGNAIVIGSVATSPAVAAKADELGLKKSVVENLAVHTLGNHLYLAGNNPRGTLYAVYYFLQKALDVRWLWPGDDGEFYPHKPVFELPELAWNHQPSLRFREMTPCYEQRHEPTQIWMARNFLNGGARTPKLRDQGGFFRHDGQHWVTLSRKDFNKYPEYFSMIGGKRVPEGQAGCWSNPGFLKLMVDKHLKLIQDNNFEILKTIHADITPRCECPECTKNPDVSSRWFEFYAKLAAELHKTYPDVLFAGSAYQEHRKVPADPVKGLEYVEYCHYNRCYVHTLDNPECKLNARSMDELRAWQKKIPMAVYGYELDVFEPFMYVPLWNIVADELRAFRDMGIIRVKTELPVIHPKNGKRSDQVPQKLRISNYIYAQLAWNPDGNPDELLRDFCRNAYGKAEKPMYDHHKSMAAAWEKMPIHLSYFLSNPSGASAHFLNGKRIDSARKLFSAAHAATAAETDPALRRRIVDNIKIDEENFTEWEKLHRVTGVSAVACVPKLSDRKAIAALKPLPMLRKRDQALPTETRIHWDDEALHLQVVCHEPEMGKLRKGSAGNDVSLWANDNVELFLDLNDGHPYRHLAVNAAGGKFDAVADDITWNPEWRAVPELRQDRWIMNISLPFRSFGGKKPAEGESWKIMVIRNSKPGACGYPAAAHHDMSRAATLYFSEKATPEKNLLWISSPRLAGGKRFVRIMPELLKRGWQFDQAAHPAAAAEKNPNHHNLIVIEKYQNPLPVDYYKNQLIPAIREGAVAVFSCYFWLEDLPAIFGDDSFQLKFVENAAKLRKITHVAEPVFSTTPNRFRSLLKFPPSGTIVPARPDAWEVLAAQETAQGTSAPFILARPLGKGMVVVAGDIKENVPLLENILHYNTAIKRQD